MTNALNALAAGFDGVFLDGHHFWRDATGRIGGNIPDAQESLAFVRWQQLHEIRQAMHRVNPAAKLGILGNHYYDTLGEPDFIIKERMYWNWDDFAKQFTERKTVVSMNMDVDYEDGQAPYAAKNIAYGLKGISPIAVQTARHFIRRPTGLFWVTTEGFLPDSFEEWLPTQAAIGSQTDLFIKQIEPADAAVHFEGQGTIWADRLCAATFSKPVRVREATHTDSGPPVARLQLAPKVRYSVGRVDEE